MMKADNGDETQPPASGSKEDSSSTDPVHQPQHNNTKVWRPLLISWAGASNDCSIHQHVVLSSDALSVPAARHAQYGKVHDVGNIIEEGSSTWCWTQQDIISKKAPQTSERFQVVTGDSSNRKDRKPKTLTFQLDWLTIDLAAGLRGLCKLCIPLGAKSSAGGNITAALLQPLLEGPWPVPENFSGKDGTWKVQSSCRCCH